MRTGTFYWSRVITEGFLLESGHHGRLWLDVDALFIKPAALQPTILELGSRLVRHQVEVICGPLLGGAYIAQAIAAHHDLECYHTERSAAAGGSELFAARYTLPISVSSKLAGKRVALVDDVINAGSAMRATRDAVVRSGGTCVVIGALLVLGSAAEIYAAANGLFLERIAHRENSIWEPSACPLCRNGIPLRKALAKE